LTNLILRTSRNTCWDCRDRIEVLMLPLEGITVVRSSKRWRRRSHAPAGRSRGAGHQDRAPDGGDFARGCTAVNGLSSYFVWLNCSKESLTSI
jgi:hypothetical protein